ncbi:MAG: hypothetical protein WBZ51_21105, partial [Xanthobacteraceae bacterium]
MAFLPAAARDCGLVVRIRQWHAGSLRACRPRTQGRYQLLAEQPNFVTLSETWLAASNAFRPQLNPARLPVTSSNGVWHG